MSAQTIAHIRFVKLDSDGVPVAPVKHPHPYTMPTTPQPLKA